MANGTDLARATLAEAQALLVKLETDAGLHRVGPEIRAEIRATLDHIKEAMIAPAYHVPGPYEIALAMAAGLAASGNYNTPGAAMSAAWMAVPEFYFARDNYLREMVPMVQGLAQHIDEDSNAASLHS